MSTEETARFTCDVILSTRTGGGEIPSNEEIQDMIFWQLDGVLDEYTGLECLSVQVIGRSGELETDPIVRKAIQRSERMERGDPSNATLDAVRRAMDKY